MVNTYQGPNAPYHRLAFESAVGQAVPARDIDQLVTAYLNLNLAQVAGTYTFGTVTGGMVDILAIEFYNDVAATGLTSVKADTDDTTPTALLASVAQAALTGGKPLTGYATPIMIASGKHLTYTIVGTGTAGSIKARVRYMPCVSGASIS